MSSESRNKHLSVYFIDPGNEIFPKPFVEQIQIDNRKHILYMFPYNTALCWCLPLSFVANKLGLFIGSWEYKSLCQLFLGFKTNSSCHRTITLLPHPQPPPTVPYLKIRKRSVSQWIITCLTIQLSERVCTLRLQLLAY